MILVLGHFFINCPRAKNNSINHPPSVFSYHQSSFCHMKIPKYPCAWSYVFLKKKKNSKHDLIWNTRVDQEMGWGIPALSGDGDV